MEVTLEMIERAAYALERHNKSVYEWTDEEFDMWWNRDPRFTKKTNVWGNFAGTEKEKLFHEIEIALKAALS